MLELGYYYASVFQRKCDNILHIEWSKGEGASLEGTNGSIFEGDAATLTPIIMIMLNL